MVTVFTVVGEHKVDNARLLVLGADGHYYGYLPRRQHFVVVEPDYRWCVYARSRDSAESAATAYGDELQRGSVAQRFQG